MAFVPDFQLVHIGVNLQNEEQAEQCAKQFSELFGLEKNKRK